MRHVTLVLALLLAVPASALTVRDLRVEAYPAEHFARIGEFYTGREVTGNRLLYRTSEEERGGVYLVLEFSEPLSQMPAGGKLVWEYVSDEASVPTVVEFSLPVLLPTGRELWLGLTDAPDVRLAEDLVAWRVQAYDGVGALVWERESFAWSAPEPE